MSQLPSVPLTTRPGRTQLIGCTHQLAVLAGCLAEARAGHPAVVLLSGPPGIGKTRLLEGFPPPGLAAGVTVLRGAASQAQGMPPYVPFLEALGDYLAAAPLDTLRDRLGPNAAVLAGSLPQLPARLGPIPPPPALGPEQERYRLYEAVVAFLAAIAADGPVVLLLDDLHWADTATCDLLVHVAGRARSAPLLVIVACRDAEAGENSAVARALAELNRRRLLVEVALRPLSASESQALVANLLGGDVAPDIGPVLHQQSEGNPFFLEELLWALIQDGQLVCQDGQWVLASQPGRLLPPRVAEAIRLRLARLDPAMAELLRVAAIAGRTCEPALLARVAGIESERAEALLLTAARARVVRADAEGAYVFVHDLVRETLAAEVGHERRRQLHATIGEVLEARGGPASPRHMADLAYHFAEAGEPARGVTYSLAAGDQALRASAAAEAMAYYRIAVRLLGGGGTAARRAVAWTGLGDAAALTGDYQQAAEAYQTAQAARLEDGDATAAATVWQRLGQVYWRQEAVEEARMAFEQALTLLGPADSPAMAEVLLQLADLDATSRGRTTDGLLRAERTLAMVERLGDRRLEAIACRVIGNIKARRNDLVAGRASLERALALAQALDEPALAAEVCAHLANVHAWVGDPDQSRAISLVRADLARRTQDPFELRHVYAWIGFIDLIQGRWDDAERWFASQARAIDGLDSPEPRAALHAHRGVLSYLGGRFDEAEVELRAMVELLRPTGSGALLWYLGWYVQVLAELGQHDEALAWLTHLRALADAQDGQARARGNAFAQLAVGYARLGERASAADCYAALLPFQGQFSPVLIDRGLGVAAGAGGDLPAARRHLMDAEAQARRAGMLPELALTLLHRGLLDRGRRASGGDSPLADGLRLCAELGMQVLGRRISGVARATSGRGPGHERRIAGLSDRELDVLRLVAQGQTNREIAAALHLSENTVARHLTHIFTKAGVENRAGAAAFALRHGLD